MTLFVDPGALRVEAQKLQDASAQVDGLAASFPTDIDGGIATAAILGIMSIFTESAGELTSALAGFGDLVTESAARYEEQDIFAAEQINTQAWTADE